MKINCVSCGFNVNLTDAYDDYEGQVKCFTCGATLEIKIQEGNVRTVKSFKAVSRPPAEAVFQTVAALGQDRS